MSHYQEATLALDTESDDFGPILSALWDDANTFVRVDSPGAITIIAPNTSCLNRAKAIVDGEPEVADEDVEGTEEE